MNKYEKANKEWWDYCVDLHVKSDFYDLKGFKEGRCTLDPIELEEIGDVRGKSLLHLQCHFGQDTMSWQRLGANATGVDFSKKAIAVAVSLAAELNLKTRFVCSELPALPNQLGEQLDIVFTSGGVLPWLPDLKAWAAVVAHFVKPGGFFYIREFHPTASIFLNDDEKMLTPTVGYPYFERDLPIGEKVTGSYAAADPGREFMNYEWPHPLSAIINSLVDAGLTIRYLHEFPYSSYQSHPFMVKSEDGRWRYPDAPESIPFMFSLKAIKL